MEYILAPSILAADFKNLGQEMKKTEENGARYLHFDVMDGMFVPSISFGMPVLASIKDGTSQTMDTSDGAGAHPLCGSISESRRGHPYSAFGGM